MVDLAGIINGINSFTQTVHTIQGAADAMLPAVYAVDSAVNQVASVFTGDQYYPAYPQQMYPVYPASPLAPLPDGKVGVVGSMLAGGVAGAMTHKGSAEAIKTIQSGGVGGAKALGMSTLKAGGIGAAVTGVISAAKNISLVSKGMQTTADAGGQIAADTIGGLLSGATGGLAAGAASMALSKIIPGGGLALTIGTAVAGALGATGTHLAYNMTGLRDGIANGVRNLFGGNSANPYGAYPQQGGYYQQPQQYYQQPQGYYQQPQYNYGY